MNILLALTAFYAIGASLVAFAFHKKWLVSDPDTFGLRSMYIVCWPTTALQCAVTLIAVATKHRKGGHQ
jgi:hypothetical protein